ncbi:hypothetical protein MPLB_1670099 [Mesorhizobium sp. ORS 3324]|nr:hypothetical protein MPLB_1670099 [Mesorhizobium sp. ORS 3324]
MAEDFPKLLSPAAAGRAGAIAGDHQARSARHLGFSAYSQTFETASGACAGDVSTHVAQPTVPGTSARDRRRDPFAPRKSADSLSAISLAGNRGSRFRHT